MNEASPLLQRSNSAPSLQSKEDTKPVLITQALPRLSAPVARDVQKAERQRRSSQKEQCKSNRFRIIEINDVKSWQNHTETTQLNPQSHHVRTTSSTPTPIKSGQKKKKKASYLVDEYSRLEQQLISSIQITEQLRNHVNTNIAIAYKKQLLRVPMIGLLRYGKEIRFVSDMMQISTQEYELVYTKDPKTISKKQLSLDLFHHEREYRTIISVILYLKSLQPPLSYVIARYPITVTPKVPDLFSEDGENKTMTTTVTTVTTTRTTTTTQTTTNGVVTPPSFIERLYLNCTRVTEPGFYYLVYVDLSLTTPELV